MVLIDVKLSEESFDYSKSVLRAEKGVLLLKEKVLPSLQLVLPLMKLGNWDGLAHGGGLSELLLSEIHLMVELLHILLLLFYQGLQSNTCLPKKQHRLDLSILTEVGALIVERNGIKRVAVIVIIVSDLCKIQESLIANQFLLIATTIWLFIRLLNHWRGAHNLKSIHLRSALIDWIRWDYLGG